MHEETPSNTEKCPNCSGEKVTRGSLLASDEVNIFNGAFYPDNLRFFGLDRAVALSVKERFQACPDCGCIWSHVDPGELQKLLENRKSSPGIFSPGTSRQAKMLWLFVLLAWICVTVAWITDLFTQ